MQVLIVLSSDVAELQWNAVRFANFLLEEGEDVSLFLNGPATGLCANDSEKFPIKELCKIFSLSEGNLLA